MPGASAPTACQWLPGRGYDDPLLRLYRPLDPLYAERWQTTEVGARGGLEVRPPFARHVAVTAEEFHADYNAWYELYGHVATTERFKPAASLAKNAEILRKVRPFSTPLCGSWRTVLATCGMLSYELAAWHSSTWKGLPGLACALLLRQKLQLAVWSLHRPVPRAKRLNFIMLMEGVQPVDCPALRSCIPPCRR